MSTYLAPNYVPALPEYQGTVPLDLLGKVGMVEQGEYNANQQAVQGQIDKLGQFPIIKDSDRQVITQKMNDLVDNLNQFSNQDLGDSRVYNKLLGITSAVHNDPEVFEKIADNQRAVSALKEYHKMIKDDPDTYGATNSAVFNKAVNEWMQTPGKSFNAAYTPYVDDSEWKKGIIDDLYKNPDTFIKTYPDGSKAPYATEELKVVLPQKIHAALSAAMPSAIANQYRINWEAQKSNYTVPGTVSELTDHIDDLMIKRTSLQNDIRTAKTDDTRKAGQAAIDRIDTAISSLSDTKHSVMETGDPSLYHTYESHVNKKFTDIGNAFAMEQHTGLKYDPFQLELFKHKLDLETEAYKAKLKSQADGPTAPVALINSLETLGYKGKTQMTADEMTHVFGGGAKPEGDNSFPITLNNRKVLVDLQPTLQSKGIDVDVRKSAGISDILDKYHQMTTGTAPIGLGVHFNTTPDPNQPLQVGGEWANRGAQGNNSGLNSQLSQGNFKKPTLQEFIKTSVQNHPEMVDYYKKNYGLDITNSKDLDAANSIPSNKEEMDAINTMTMNLTNFGGTYKAYPGDGDNTIIGSSGELQGNVLLEFTKKQLTDQVTDKGSWNSDNYFRLLKSGVIKDVHKTTQAYGKGEELYQISVHVPSTKDVGLAVSNYSGEHATKKEGIDVANEQLNLWKNTANRIAGIQRFISNPDVSVGYVKSQVLSIIKDPGTKQNAQNLMDQITLKLKQDIPVDQKKVIINALIQLSQATSEDQINQILSH